MLILLTGDPATSAVERFFHPAHRVGLNHLLSHTCRRRDGPIGLEDGTTAFLAIASLQHGFAAIRRAGGFQTISAHARAVTQCVLSLPASCPVLHGADRCLTLLPVPTSTRQALDELLANVLQFALEVVPYSVICFCGPCICFCGP